MKRYDYYRVSFKFIRPVLGTGTEAPLYDKHIIAKAKRLIKEANNSAKAMTKALAKYKGDSISEEKAVKDLQGIIRHIQAQIGNPEPAILPTDADAILELWDTLSKELRDSLEEGDDSKETIFLKNKDGYPIMSTHMILGNFKENAKNLVNNGDKILPSKTAVGEVFNTDIKPVEEYMVPSKDIIRNVATPTGEYDEETAIFAEAIQGGRLTNNDPNRVGRARLFERPLRAMTQQGPKVAIARSEVIPTGAEMSCTLRIRKGSPITEEMLHTLLAMGRNNGIGQWRGSGNMGAYKYKLEALPDYVEPGEDDINGWL